MTTLLFFDRGLTQCPTSEEFTALIASDAVGALAPRATDGKEPPPPPPPPAPGAPPSLMLLNLAFNSLRECRSLAALPQLATLVKLDLRHNRLHSLAGLEVLQALRCLKACGNAGVRSIKPAMQLPLLEEHSCLVLRVLRKRFRDPMFCPPLECLKRLS